MSASWPRRRLLLVFALLAGVGLLVWALGREPTASREATKADPGAAPERRRWSAEGAEYVGTARCGGCHAEALEAFSGSHHDRAIEEPGADTVLAPFEGEAFAHDGVESTFRRDGDGFAVRTPGPDGEAHDYPVAYTFGVYPLQQYLLDMGGGRLQSFTVAWDARSEARGGQRYFDLYADETLGPGDPLHWTGSMQNWNSLCADCHSTALHKGYDAERDEFETHWAELDVGCEACHGPGSAHVAWAEAGAEGSPAGLAVNLRRAPAWEILNGSKSAAPRPGSGNRAELRACAPCHSRRQQLREGRTPDEPLLDAYRPELLRAGLYHDDGQIDAEVYVYGSFLQSRMFHAGVRCSDCHEPHSSTLRRQGNALCTGCHAKQVFDIRAHHHHEGEGSACVDCHMPSKTYMGVDVRRDHSLRLPRPDLAARVGAPDPCTGCHAERSPRWAADRIAAWFGGQRRPHYGDVLHAARAGDPDAERDLISLARDGNAPAIVRGTALSELSGREGEAVVEALARGARSDEALVRLGAVAGASELPPPQRLAVLGPLLDDPRLAVRTEAARGLSALPLSRLPAREREALRRGLAELLDVERLHADRPDAWLRIATIELGQGNAEGAGAALEKALELESTFTPALVNLADLRRVQGDEAAAEELLRRALALEPENAEAWHALGLTRVRRGDPSGAAEMLRRAADLRPDSARFMYVLAVALADGGDLRGAMEVLERGLERHPNDPAMLQALSGYAHQLGAPVPPPGLPGR